MAPPRKNTLFANTPYKLWTLREKGQRMWREHKELMEWISNLLRESREPFQYTDESGKVKSILRTAEKGFFRVIMRAYTGAPKVELLFSLRDLYLVGFLPAEKWYFYKDAVLDGSGHKERHHIHEWDLMNFPGNYCYFEDCFTTIQIGVACLEKSLDVLLDHSNYSDSELWTALYRPVVAISESMRFLTWQGELLRAFNNCCCLKVGSDFGDKFKDWSTTCKNLRKGTGLAEGSQLAVVLWRDKERKKFGKANLQNVADQHDPDDEDD